MEVTNVGEKDSKGEENKVVTNGSTVTVTDKDDDLPRKITLVRLALVEQKSQVLKSRSTRATRQKAQL